MSCCISDASANGNFVTEYDPDLNVLKNYSVAERQDIVAFVSDENGVECLTFVGGSDRYRVIRYDIRFNEISTSDVMIFPDDFSALSSNVPQEYYGIESSTLALKGFFALQYQPSGGSIPELLVFANSKKQAVARASFKTLGQYFFDGKGALWVRVQNEIRKYAMNLNFFK
jgi:hypothetical protein